MEIRLSEFTVLVVGGTGESYPGDTRTDVSGMLAGVTGHLSRRFTSRWVGYPAEYGPVGNGAGGTSFHDSVRAGVRNLAQAAAGTIGPIVLLGYSQGCTVVREFLSTPGAAESLGIVAAGFVADPQMPPGAAYGKPQQSGWGIAGKGGDVPVPAWWIANDRDPIPNASPDSLLRDIADLTEFMTATDSIGWARAVIDRLLRSSWQNSWGAKNPLNLVDVWRARRRVDTALAEAFAYLPQVPVLNDAGGEHTSYGVEAYLSPGSGTGCEVLASLIEANVRL
ncbi:PE-PPE domain-containing protein [Nocardia acidivorans]|uniref:PE-PPE domain-containing protein n=1 Tax=Nocardia acidivorans TaxID=404580 RepID=UPI001FE17265|nr:PE-PPE domain-containing protein [Nocardia acidivorans]